MSIEAAPGPTARRRPVLSGAWLRHNAGLIALAILLVFNIAVTPNFLELQTLFVNISQVATIAIVAIGMTVVIATGGIDLSVGAVMALAGRTGPADLRVQLRPLPTRCWVSPPRS